MSQLIMNIEQKSLNYTVSIEPNLLAEPAKWLPSKYHGKKIVIITDHHVRKLYAETLKERIALLSNDVMLLSVTPGEHSKSRISKAYIEDEMIRHQCDRDTLILALGGGVVGDLAGFVAACYFRGINYIQIPTTLLAMVDSSIGGKTGIDTALGKNLIGAYWQPQQVIADINCLKSLPKQQLLNGLIEALKMFMTNDLNSLEQAQQNFSSILHYDIAYLSQLVKQAVAIKLGIVSQDEKDANYRMILNFGHTIGHAIECLASYQLLHGHAVGLGILVEAKIAVLQGLLKEDDYQYIKQILAQCQIHGHEIKQWDIEKILETTKIDKKNKGGQTHYILIKGLGAVYTEQDKVAFPIADDEVKKALTLVSEE